MPELPDVEGFRRYLARHAAGRRIEAPDPEILRNASAAAGRALKGRRLGEPERHGKWLVAPADGRALLLHSA